MIHPGRLAATLVLKIRYLAGSVALMTLLVVLALRRSTRKNFEISPAPFRPLDFQRIPCRFKLHLTPDGDWIVRMPRKWCGTVREKLAQLGLQLLRTPELFVVSVFRTGACIRDHQVFFLKTLTRAVRRSVCSTL